MRPAASLVLTLFCALIFPACGSDGTNADPYSEAATQAVQGAALTLDDLPTGWAPSALGDDSYANIQLTGECAQLNERGGGFPGAVSSADSDPFTGPLGQELVNTVTAFNNSDEAVAAVRLANDLVLQCTEQIKEALKQAIEVAAEDRNVGGLLGNINTAVEPDDTFPVVGDETVAYTLSADFSALFARFEVNGHIVAIRDGPLAGVLVYAGLGQARSEEEEGIAAKMAEKLAQAEQSLID